MTISNACQQPIFEPRFDDVEDSWGKMKTEMIGCSVWELEDRQLDGQKFVNKNFVNIKIEFFNSRLAFTTLPLKTALFSISNLQLLCPPEICQIRKRLEVE